MRKTRLRDVLLALAVACLASPAFAASDEGSGQAGATGTGLPVPRFVSLKADKVNVRNGPNRDQDVAWIFSRAGLPVEITAEFEPWRRIRDSEGAEGWVYHSLLSGRRTALVAPWLKSGTVALREKASADSSVNARLEHGVLGSLKACDGQWCRFTGPGFDGFIEQNQLWGVYPGEKID